MPGNHGCYGTNLLETWGKSSSPFWAAPFFCSKVMYSPIDHPTYKSRGSILYLKIPPPPRRKWTNVIWRWNFTTMLVTESTGDLKSVNTFKQQQKTPARQNNLYISRRYNITHCFLDNNFRRCQSDWSQSSNDRLRFFHNSFGNGYHMPSMHDISYVSTSI